jgi:large subunit ribosomal protein L9
MEVILEKDVPNLGQMGEVVEVSNGYGRNYLLPQGLAKQATPGRKKEIEHRKRVIDARKQKQQEEAREIKGEIEGLSVTIPARVAESDSLYGSIGPQDIAEAVGEEDFEVEPNQVELDEGNIGELGIYKVDIKLASGIFAEITVWIVAL